MSCMWSIGMLTFGCFNRIVTFVTSITHTFCSMHPVSMITQPSSLLLSPDSISWWLRTHAPQVPNSVDLNLWKIFIDQWQRLIIDRFTSTPSFLLGGNRLIFSRFWCIRKKSIRNLGIRVDLWWILGSIPQFFCQNRNFLLHDFWNRVRVEDLDFLIHDLIDQICEHCLHI